MRKRRWVVCIAVSLGVVCEAAEPSTVAIEVTGTIPPKCANAGVPNGIQLDNLKAGGSSSVQFEINCNTPFAYTVQSANGAFQITGGTVTGTNLQTRVPYNLAITIPLDNGRAIADRCSSQSIAAGRVTCPFSTSGEQVAILRTGTMRLEWHRSSAHS